MLLLNKQVGREARGAARVQVHSRRKVVLVVNKCESEVRGLEQAAHFWAYGHEPLPVSAISGTGTGEMMERLVSVRRFSLLPLSLVFLPFCVFLFSPWRAARVRFVMH